MNFFKKLFSSNSNNDTAKKTVLPMDEIRFWDIIQQSLNNSQNLDEQAEYIAQKVKGLTTDEIIGFKLALDKLLHNSYTSELWCAAYIINGGCSDDGFEDFRCWLISKGKNVYYYAVANPDSLISQLSEEEGYYEFEDLLYISGNAFEEKTGNKIYDYIDNNVNSGEGHYPDIQFNWQEEDEESMKRICPKLFEKMMA